MTDSVWRDTAKLAKEGTWLLEASAGTGKTYQLANLVARLVVAEGVPIERVLVITFTRAATGELRARIRDRLVQVRDALLERLDTGLHVARRDDRGEAADPVLDLLCDVDQDTAEMHHTRLMTALSCFDLAPISTIHGFSQRMLDVLAFESEQDPGLTLLEDLGPIREQLVADALANVQARTPAGEFAQWKDCGWTAANLNDTVKAATSVVGRRIEPDVGGAPQAFSADKRAAKEAFVQWWLASNVAAELRADIARRPGDYKPSRRWEYFDAQRQEIDQWCADSSSYTIDKVTNYNDGFGTLRVFSKRATDGATVNNQRNRAAKFAHPEPERIAELIAELETAATTAAPLAAFAQEAAETVHTELRKRRLLTFDAILTRLADAIAKERKRGGATPLADAVAQRFDAALIDEFQDTDSAQWQVFKHVFVGRENKRLFLVGDPKQAIYAFRGADVFVYLAAKKTIDSGADNGGRFTMTTNWRSDGQLVDALGRFWVPDSKAFGALQMDFVDVAAAPKNAGWRLQQNGVDKPARKPLEIRWLQGHKDESTGRPRALSAADALFGSARSCAVEIAEMLQGGWTLPGDTDAGQPERRALIPGDFAVIVLMHKQAAAVKSALARHGIMAVRAGHGTVFESPVTQWLLQWLDAVGNPGFDAAARSLAVSPLIGRTLEQLGRALDEADTASVSSDPAADDADGGPDEAEESDARALRSRDKPLVWATWVATISKWASLWQKNRFIGVFGRMLTDYDVIESVLRCRDGERLATDLRHLAELCHVAERKHHFTPAALAEWVREQQTRAEFEAESPRLESDANAVQIVTVYRAKGLQYPIVMAPFGWSKGRDPDKSGPLIVHPGGGGEAVLDLHHKDSPDRVARAAQHNLERRQERIRKLYVTMTRAKHHCVLWGAQTSSGFEEATANAMILRGLASDSADDRGSDSHELHDRYGQRFKGLVQGPLKSGGKAKVEARWQAINSADERLPAALSAVVERGGGQIGLRIVTPPVGRPKRVELEADSDPTEGLVAATFDRRDNVSSAWQRASYSSMPRGRGFDDPDLQIEQLKASNDEEDLAAAKSDPDLDAAGNEVASDQTADEKDIDRLRLPLAKMWGGTTVGTWAHAVLEWLEFAPPQLDGKDAIQPEHFGQWRLVDKEDRAKAAAASPYRKRHEGSEHVSASQLAHELGDSHGHRRRADHVDFVLALPHIMHTPLRDDRMGDWALPEGYCLARLGDKDRLDEMAFDLSLVGGERWSRNTSGKGDAYIDPDKVIEAMKLRLAIHPAWDGKGWLNNLVAKVAHSHTEIENWQRLPESERKKQKKPKPFSVIPPIAGILTGLIDLTFRLPGGGKDGADAYYVADYKTNKITAPGDRVLKPAFYKRNQLGYNMSHANYHLQGLIYCLALHRFLRDRLPGYDYDTHVGGHLYLYLRGMQVGDNGTFVRRDADDVRGVYADRWPRACIVALDKALDPRLFEDLLGAA